MGGENHKELGDPGLPNQVHPVAAARAPLMNSNRPVATPFNPTGAGGTARQTVLDAATSGCEKGERNASSNRAPSSGYTGTLPAGFCQHGERDGTNNAWVHREQPWEWNDGESIVPSFDDGSGSARIA